MVSETVRNTTVVSTSAVAGICAVALVLYGCNVAPRKVNDTAIMAQITPAQWRQPGMWKFEVFDNDRQALGHIVLYLTGEDIGAGYCVDDYWKEAIVMDNKLNVELSFEARPAYNVKGPWLTVDLTATTCNVHHNLVGDVDGEGAAGTYNYIHLLGSFNVGTFTASPLVD